MNKLIGFANQKVFQNLEAASSLQFVIQIQKLPSKIPINNLDNYLQEFIFKENKHS